MEDAYILEILRSPVGKFLGSLSEFSAPDLAIQVVTELVKRSEIKKEDIDGIIAGNVLSAGLGQNPAKQIIVHSGLPYKIPTLNVNMVCASSLKAISLAAESIQAGNSDIIIAGGMESMSNAPHTLKGLRKFRKLGPISRKDQDEFALESHRKAAEATDSGMFKDEIAGIKPKDGRVIDKDEGIRRDTSLEVLSKLKPAFVENGTVTAGNASQTCLSIFPLIFPFLPLF